MMMMMMMMTSESDSARCPAVCSVSLFQSQATSVTPTSHRYSFYELSLNALNTNTL